MADRWLISSTGQESTVLRPGFLCPPDPKPPISLYLWLSTPACVEHLFARELCSHENGTRSATRGTDDIATLRYAICARTPAGPPLPGARGGGSTARRAGTPVTISICIRFV